MRPFDRLLGYAMAWQVASVGLVMVLLAYAMWFGGELILPSTQDSHRTFRILIQITSVSMISSCISMAALWFLIGRRVTMDAFGPTRHIAFICSGWLVQASAALWLLVWSQAWDRYRGPPVGFSVTICFFSNTWLQWKAMKIQDGYVSTVDHNTWIARDSEPRSLQRPGVIPFVGVETVERGRSRERLLLVLLALAALSLPLLTQLVLASVGR